MSSLPWDDRNLKLVARKKRKKADIDEIDLSEVADRVKELAVIYGDDKDEDVNDAVDKMCKSISGSFTMHAPELPRWSASSPAAVFDEKAHNDVPDIVEESQGAVYDEYKDEELNDAMDTKAVFEETAHNDEANIVEEVVISDDDTDEDLNDAVDQMCKAKRVPIAIVDVLERYKNFKRFDTVVDHSDHLFSSSPIEQTTEYWAEKIQNERRILEEGLPETIFVRAYESRMDLLRAVIIGAKGTPYHDGLFFFDVYFPPMYPREPPLVRYHSYGFGINPHLF